MSYDLDFWRYKSGVKLDHQLVYEQLSNGEAAQVLGIQERAAAKRYVRALKRLREMLADMPGGLLGLGL